MTVGKIDLKRDMGRSKMDYLVWAANPAGGYCGLKILKNVEDSYELKRGISRAKGFPSDACFHMDESHPKQIKLADNITNLDGLAVVSKGLKEFVEFRKPSYTEFLPITIYNHKGRIASKEYFIINPFKIQDCIDLNKSGVRWNAIDPELISSWSKLVIDTNRIDINLLLFRPKYKPSIVMVRRDLVEEIKKGGFTGIYFFDVDKFKG